MSTNQRSGPTEGPATEPTRPARLAIRALLHAATPGPIGRRPWGETPLAMAQREAAAAGVVPEGGDGLASNARLMERLQSSWRVLFVGIWLLYLTDTFKDAWHSPDPAWRFVGTTAILAFCLLYLGVFLSIRRFRASLLTEPSKVRSWGVLGLGVLLILLTAQAAGESALAMCVYLAVLTMFLLPARQGAPVVVLNAALVALLSNLIPGWEQADLLSFQILITGLAIWGILQLLQRNNQLAQAREEITSLAVSEERLRFSRDLHDILGHSLTVITLKAELAGRLVQVDPARAEREIAEVEQLARTALADVRTTAAGYRNLTLAAELASARTALDTAGIEAELSGAVDDVPVERLELFGWAVREGVTNVVRHSGARHCRVTVDSSQVEITDDGTGPGRSSIGNGLTGLRERAEAAGAQVLIDAAEHGGFRLRVGW
jgi:two-component system sensor histidine kinase DesK